MKIGVAGTGRMGAAIAARLKAAGHEVAVWNRTAAKARSLGFPVIESPRGLADASEVVISMLADGEAVLETPLSESPVEATRTTSASGRLIARFPMGIRVDEDETRWETIVAFGGKADRVRDTVSTMASRDLDRSRVARIEAAAMLERVDGINRNLGTGMREIAECSKSIDGSVAEAVRSLQFEDIATQALGAANVHLDRLGAINREATVLQDLLHRSGGQSGAELRQGHRRFHAAVTPASL